MSDELKGLFHLKTSEKEKEFFSKTHPLTNKYNFKAYHDLVILIIGIMTLLFISTFIPYTMDDVYRIRVRVLYAGCAVAFLLQIPFLTVCRKFAESHSTPFLYLSFALMYAFSLLHNLADRHGYPYTLSLCCTVIFPMIFLDRKRRVVKLSFLHLGIALVLSYKFKMIDAFINDIFNCCIWTVTGIILGESLRRNQINYINLKEQQLSDNLEIEKAKNEAKSIFLAKMSHEIRTPINAVLGFDEMILREEDRKEILGYAENIKSAGKTLLSLVNDILDFSKIEANKMEIIKTEYDLASMLNDLINMVIQRAQAKGIDFNVAVDDTTPRLLFGDEMRIKQCVVNLLTNAIKYTNSGSVTLSVGWQKNDDHTAYLCFSVRDTGIGIKEEDIGKLFTAFERIEENRNRTIEGTGLGISIVNQLLTMMGSKLEIQSTYGSGSEFSFSILQDIVWWDPVGDFAENYRQAMESSSSYKESFHAPDARILVVDDTKMNLSVIREFLKQTQLQVDTVESGTDMLNYVQQKHYDVIFIDHYMPVMDGIEALHKLKALPENPNSNVPCIALTANAVSGAREMYLAEGFTDYLTKPVDSAKLELMLLSYLPGNLVTRITLANSGTDAKEPLPEIEGIDSAEAMANCGSRHVFRDAAADFCNSMEENAASIERYAQQKDFRNYTVLVHALKSSARLIGATELARAAAELEALSDRQDAAGIAEKTPALLAQYRSCAGRLQPFTAESPAQGKLAMAKDMFTGAIADIKQCIQAFDFDTAEQILSMMEQYKLPVGKENKFQKIKKYVFAGNRSELLNLL